MEYCEDFKLLASYLLNCGTLDLCFLFRDCEEWGIDYTEAIDKITERAEKVNFDNLIREVYDTHIKDIKKSLKEILKEIESDNISFNYKNLDDYYVNVFFNYLDTSFVDKYEFWEAKDGWDVAEEYLDEFVNFLIDENIAKVECDGCDKYEFLKKEIRKYVRG